ncbi:MAG: hypothetical protein J4G03_03100 [Gemmatimonadetes bacterium]|nr:hypothetical protein [Gemmatimonadota bacterium]
MHRFSFPLVTLVAGGTFADAACARPLTAQKTEGTPEVVAYTGEDSPLEWRFEQLWRLGGVDDIEIGAIKFISVNNVATDQAGNLYVLDRTAPRVLVISPEGSLIASLGSRGEGPGEFSNPLAVSISGGDLLTVYDLARGGLVRWRIDDRTVADPVRVRAQYSYGLGLHVDGDAVHFAAHQFLGASGEELSSRYSLVRWTPAATTLLLEGQEFKRVPAHLPQCKVFGTHMAQIFEPVLAWVGRDDRIAVAGDRDYIVHIFDGGEPTLKIERDLAARQVTEDMARREAQARMGELVAPNCDASPTQAARALGHAEYLQAVTGVAVSPDHDIWVRRGTLADEERLIDVFGPAGEYRGTLPSGSPWPAEFAGPDRVLVLGTDEFDVPTITAYRVVRDEPR